MILIVVFIIFHRIAIMSLRTLSSVCSAVVFLLVFVEVLSGDLDVPANQEYPKAWLSKIFYETLADFTGPMDVGSSTCRKQMQMYVKHLQNDSLWAVQSQYNILWYTYLSTNKIYLLILLINKNIICRSFCQKNL